MTDLAIYGVNRAELTNTLLAANIEIMVNALTNMNFESWDFAQALECICTDELFKEDFKTKGNFAKAVGISSATLSQNCGAVKFLYKVLPSEFLGIYKAKGVQYCYTCSTVDFEAFTDWCANNNHVYTSKYDIAFTSVSELKKAIKDFKAWLDEQNNTVDAESVEEVEDSEECETNEAEASENDVEVKATENDMTNLVRQLVEVKLSMSDYEAIMSILKNYK